jgi:hypothetical protein
MKRHEMLEGVSVIPAEAGIQTGTPIGLNNADDADSLGNKAMAKHSISGGRRCRPLRTKESPDSQENFTSVQKTSQWRMDGAIHLAGRDAGRHS